MKYSLPEFTTRLVAREFANYAKVCCNFGCRNV